MGTTEVNFPVNLRELNGHKSLYHKGMSSAAWRMQTFGGFRLLDPNGAEVQIRMRKTAGLAVVLARHYPESVRREDLEHGLWPESSREKQQASLRQAIAALRAVVGAETILTNRSSVRWNPDVPLDADFWNNPAPEQPFMPEMPEAWFVRERARLSDATAFCLPNTRPLTPSDHLLQLARWYAPNDPAMVLRLLRDHKHIVDGIPSSQLSHLIQGIQPSIRADDPLQGWAEFWLGMATMNSDLRMCAQYFDRSLKLALRDKDIDLALQTAAWYASSFAVRGKLSSAEAVLRQTIQAVGPQYGVLNQASGAIYAHIGDEQESMKYLDLALDTAYTSDADITLAAALRALHIATMNPGEAAERELQSVKSAHKLEATVRFNLCVVMTELTIAVGVYEHTKAKAFAGRLITMASETDAKHFLLYAHEALAVIAYRTGAKRDFLHHAGIADRLRQTIGFSMTEWDYARLHELGAALRQKRKLT